MDTVLGAWNTMQQTAMSQGDIYATCALLMSLASLTVVAVLVLASLKVFCAISVNDGIDRYKLNDEVSSIIFMVICMVEVCYFKMNLQQCSLDMIHYVH